MTLLSVLRPLYQRDQSAVNDDRTEQNLPSGPVLVQFCVTAFDKRAARALKM